MPETLPEPEETYSDFVFDTQYESPFVDDVDELYMTVFRVTKGQEERFVHLFNRQNGYCSHGFTVKHGDKLVKEGDL